MHLLLWMIVMFDSIFIGFAELSGTGNERKIHNENICLHRESNQGSLSFQPNVLDRSATKTYIFIFNFSLVSPPWQLGEANTNEVEHDSNPE